MWKTLKDVPIPDILQFVKDSSRDGQAVHGNGLAADGPPDAARDRGRDPHAAQRRPSGLPPRGRPADRERLLKEAW
jgi:hypothetical protein